MVVRDHGPGFPPGLLAEGPQRLRTGAAGRGPGHGLGLTIAVDQAQVIRARLTFANSAPHGASPRSNSPLIRTRGGYQERASFALSCQ
ncbi:ATP-binding protein [Streptomyces lasalocidi]